jgi:hypothetical protein
MLILIIFFTVFVVCAITIFNEAQAEKGKKTFLK